MRRLPIILTALALLAALAPLAGAQQQAKLQGGMTLKPLAVGSLWKTGVLYGATMYAQAGRATTVKIEDIHVPGQTVIGQPTLTIFACELTSKTVAPSVRADNTNGTATCVQIGTRNVRQGQTVKLAVPLAQNGKFLAMRFSFITNLGAYTTTSGAFINFRATAPITGRASFRAASSRGSR